MKTAIALIILLSMTVYVAAIQAVQVGSAIRGRILDRATKSALAEVRLSLMASPGGASIGMTASDSEGGFEFRVAPGSYWITPTREGYVLSKPEGRQVDVKAVYVAVSSPGLRSDLLLEMEKAGVIAGRVFDSNGVFVPSMNVAAVQASYDEYGERAFSTSGRSLTNDKGEFRVFGLGAGEYYVRVQGRTRGQPAVLSYTLFHPSVAEETRAERVLVRSGEETVLPSLVVPLIATAPVHIDITTSLPIPAIRTMQLGPKDAPELITVSEPSLVNGGPRAINHPGLPAGQNWVRVAWEVPGGKAYGETLVDVPESGQRVTADVFVGTGRTLTAQAFVQSEGTTPPSAPSPLEGVTIELSSPPLGEALSGKTNTQGMLVFGSTPESTYRIKVSGLPRGLCVARVRSNGQDIKRSRLQVTGDLQIQVLAESRCGTVEGKVLDVKADPVPGGIVALVPAKVDDRDILERGRVAMSDQDGKFVARDLPPGRYKVFAWAETPGTGAYRNSDFLKRYEDSGVEIVLGAEQTLSVELMVARAAE